MLKLETKFSNLPKVLIAFVFLTAFFFLAVQESYGQTPVYATNLVSSSGTDNPTNATNGSESLAKIKSNAGLALGIGKYSGHIELRYPETINNNNYKIPAGTTSYIKMGGGSDDLLNALLGGSLGTLLADVLGIILLGNHSFEIEAKDINTVVSSASTTSNFTSTDVRTFTSTDGSLYLAITPKQPYTSIRITDHTSAVLGLGAGNHIEVKNVFYLKDVPTCASVYGTSYDGSGIDLDLLNLGGSIIDNQSHAIDNDLSTYSNLSAGLLSVGGSISQHFYFAGDNPANSIINITLGSSESLLDVSVLNSLEIIAYDNNVQVYSGGISQLLGLDLLGLFESGQKFTIPFKIPLTYDRIEIKLNKVIELGTNQGLRIYEVSSTPAITLPTLGTLDSLTTSCGELNLQNVIANYTADYTYKYYTTASGGTPLESGIVNTSGTYYIEALNPLTGCTSDRVMVNVTINPLPTATIENSLNICVGDNETTLTLSNVTNGGNQYKITWNEEISGLNNVEYTAFPSSGPIIISGLSTVPANNYSGSLVIRNSNTGCESVPYNFTLKVLPAPGRPQMTIQSSSN